MGETRRVVCSGSLTFVAMMQAANFGERNDLPLFGPLDGSRFRGIFLQCQVCPTSVVVREVALEHALQVSLVEADDVVQAFAANRPDQPFDGGRLPRCTRSNADLLQVQCFGAAAELQTIEAIAVREQV